MTTSQNLLCLRGRTEIYYCKYQYTDMSDGIKLILYISPLKDMSICV